MPELPDVEGFRRYFDEHARGRQVTRTRVTDEQALRNTTPQALGRALKNRRFGEPRRWGKWLLAPTDGGPSLLLHFGMTALLVSSDDTEQPGDHDRVVFEFDAHGDGGWLAYRSQRKLGGIWLCRSDQEPEEITGAIGPDAAELSREDFHDLLGGRRGGVKSALMDQELLAGVGNELSDEVLWRARTHPRTSVSAVDLDSLYDALREALEAAIPAGRIPEADGWLEAVRGDADPRCPRCGAPVHTGTVAGRTSYWCTDEQPEPA